MNGLNALGERRTAPRLALSKRKLKDVLSLPNKSAIDLNCYKRRRPYAWRD